MTGPIPLSRANLSRLPAVLERPQYPLDSVTPGIVHLGLGAFHRAHMARYTHDLMQADPQAWRWGIVGAGLMPTDRATCEGLMAQDNLYTLVERQADREAATVVGSICGVEFAGDSAAALLRRLDDPNITIVSLTVTERGYCLNAATKELDSQHPAILSGRIASLQNRPGFQARRKKAVHSWGLPVHRFGAVRPSMQKEDFYI